jgi:sugar O-acyltransferase (sialic acid O-acetyltransferase NeuD family)
MGRSALVEWADAKVLAVPGGPKSYQFRKLVIDGLGLAPGQFATIVHPTARLSPLARIGHNVLIMAGVVVTSNAVIGNHVCLLPNTVIHHDAVLGDWSLIGSNVTIAGSVIVGENCYVGSGASIMNGLQVGHKALVDIGSNVIRPVPAGSKVVGNPARQIT